jgi:hypothetical protein
LLLLPLATYVDLLPPADWGEGEEAGIGEERRRGLGEKNEAERRWLSGAVVCY